MAFEYADEPGQETSALELGSKSVMHDQRIPIRRKLQFQIERREKELSELKNALTALDSNPEFEKLHDTLSKVSRFL